MAVLLTGALAWHIYRTISGGLGNIEHTLERVSASLDLSAAMPVERMDEVGRTATAFNKFLERIVGVIATVRARPIRSAWRPRRFPPATRTCPCAPSSRRHR